MGLLGTLAGNEKKSQLWIMCYFWGRFEIFLKSRVNCS
jgi:hypothetical protein